ncbi:substrate-binding domain-containing protein [Microbacterium tumbae]
MTGIGLVIPADGAGDHFVSALRQAVAEPLIAAGFGLFTRVVEDAEAEKGMYRRWADSEGIAGVVMLGGHDDAERIALLRALRLPFAAVVPSDEAGDFPAVAIDVAESVAVISTFLTGRRHERTVYVTASLDTVTSRSREKAMAEDVEVVQSGGSTRNAVAAAMSVAESGPATLLFDSDVHAHEVITVLLRAGRRVPEDVSVMSWTDSALCRSSAPAITAVDRRGGEIGEMLGRRMLATIAGGAPVVDRAPAPFIVSRDSA